MNKTILTLLALAFATTTSLSAFASPSIDFEAKDIELRHCTRTQIEPFYELTHARTRTEEYVLIVVDELVRRTMVEAVEKAEKGITFSVNEARTRFCEMIVEQDRTSVDAILDAYYGDN